MGEVKAQWTWRRDVAVLLTSLVAAAIVALLLALLWGATDPASRRRGSFTCTTSPEPGVLTCRAEKG